MTTYRTREEAEKHGLAGVWDTAHGVVTAAEPPGRWTVTVPGFLPTPLNRLLRLHWAKRSRVVKHEAKLVANYSAGVPKARGKRRVSIHMTLAGRDRERDPDGVWKNTLDSLVKAGLLVDDSAAWVELGPVTFARGGARATAVVIEDV